MIKNAINDIITIVFMLLIVAIIITLLALIIIGIINAWKFILS